MADELIGVGSSGLKKRLQDQGDGTVAEYFALGGLRSLLDSIRADQGIGTFPSAAWLMKLTDGSTIVAVNADGSVRVSSEGGRRSYSASIVGLVAASACTDLFTIKGAASIVTRVTRIKISGVATAAAIADVTLIKRSTSDTAGTSTAPTAVPHDAVDAAAVAVIAAYTVNPTVGTPIAALRSDKLFLAAAGTPTLPQVLVYEFGLRNTKGLYLRDANQQLAINLNAGTFAGNLFDIDVEWTEDAS